MPEYIERSDAAVFFENSKQTMWHKDDVAATISSKKAIPAADVVEVVRCSECKYFGKELKQGKYSCLNYQLPYCLENDYCSYGERKDDDEE